MSIWTRAFWKATTERAVRTFAQAAGATLVGTGTGLIDTDWIGVLSVAGMAAVLAVLFAVGAGAATGTGPSLGSAETLAETTTVAVTAPTDVHVDVQADEPRDRGATTVEQALIVLGIVALVVVVLIVLGNGSIRL